MSHGILYTKHFQFFGEVIHHYLNSAHAYLLKRAGDVAALSFRPSDEGFMVKTTWRFLMTWLVNHL